MSISTALPLKELIPVTPRGEATRRKLLASAEIEFGSKGFPAASVSSITQRADVGQGTFYLYFHSKEQVFATLVRDIGAGLCGQVTALEPAKDKDAERRVTALMLAFVAAEAGQHRILSEAQFVDEPVFRETQEKLLMAVATQLVGSSAAAAALPRAAALMGASAQVAMLHVQWGGKSNPDTLVEAVIGAA